MYLDDIGKLWVIFVQKYCFTLVKKKGQNITFLAICQKYDF